MKSDYSPDQSDITHHPKRQPRQHYDRQQPSSPRQDDDHRNGDNSLDSLRVLGERLREARDTLQLSIRDVEALSGVPKSVIARIEQGSPPRPTTLKDLARVLELDLAQLYRLAGYDIPQTPSALPTFTPYLRSKYAGIPPAAQAELQRSFARIAKKHGYDPDGPKPGEDETDDVRERPPAATT